MCKNINSNARDAGVLLQARWISLLQEVRRELRSLSIISTSRETNGCSSLCLIVLALWFQLVDIQSPCACKAEVLCGSPSWTSPVSSLSAFKPLWTCLWVLSCHSTTHSTHTSHQVPSTWVPSSSSPGLPNKQKKGRHSPWTSYKVLLLLKILICLLFPSRSYLKPLGTK